MLAEWLLVFVVALFLMGVYIFSLRGGFSLGGKKLFRVSLEKNPRSWKELATEHLPLGLLLVNEAELVLWANNYFTGLVGKRVLPGLELAKIFPGYTLQDQKSTEQAEIYHWSKKVFYLKALFVPAEQQNYYVLICEDITQSTLSNKRGQDFQPMIAFIQVDNLGEVIKNMAEENKPHLQGALERVLTDWSSNLEGYLKQTGEAKYLLFFNQWGFRQAEKSRFAILDRVREVEAGNAMPLTISIGIGIQEDSVSEMGRLASHALDLALDRGGDQVVVKSPEQVRFYGGKSSSSEKRTKVKARVTAYALKDLILQASNVIIMGHDLADYDSLGAALGLAKAVQDLGKKSYVLLDHYNPATDRLLDALPLEGASAGLIKARDALRKVKEQTLLIIVDTHKPSLLANPLLLEKISNIAVIDHHRRGEEFIPNPKLVYLETYASSTSELVTELLQYLGDEVEIGKAEATALLAGITVDTKNFMFQTGARTFEAASYLRGLGADPAVVQTLLRDDLATVVRKAEVVSKARVLFGQIALAVSTEESEDAQLLAAKTADTMLNIAGVNASFVLWSYQGGVAISARSNGQINVQVIMERLGGGGHLTVAAAQVNDTIAQVEKRMGELFNEIFGEEVQS